jgi:hypothetical protein
MVGLASNQTKQMKSLLLAAVTVIASLFAEDKIEAHCPYNECCPTHCETETLMTAAGLLFNNWCSIINTEGLNQLQDLLTKESRLQVVMLDGQECVDSGFQPYLDNVIPLMPDLTCPVAGNITAIFMEGKSKVVTSGIGLLILGIEPVQFLERHVFEVVNGCELKLVESSLIQVQCVPQ